MQRCATGFGVPVRLDITQDAAAAVDAVLPYWWRDEEPGEDVKTFDVPDAGSAASVVSALELWVAEHAAGLVFVHAGVVARGDRALLLPGRSFAGKSTLTAALVRAGCTYGSDEYAVLQPDGLVQPYPRRIALRTPDGVSRIPVEDLGGAVFAGPLLVAAVADLRFEPDLPPQLDPMSPGAAALRLFDNAVCASSRPMETLETVTRAAQDARALQGTRAEASVVVPTLLELLAPSADAR